MPVNPALQWVHINDFRAGIKNRSSPALGTLQGPSNQLVQRFKQTSGLIKNGQNPVDEVAAVGDAHNTYRCWALPNGALAPLPNLAPTLALGASTPLDPTLTVTGRLSITGMRTIGTVGIGFETHMAMEAKKTSDGKRYWFWRRIRNFSANQVDAIKSLNPSAETTPDQFVNPTWFDVYRAAATDPAQPGIPGITCGTTLGGGINSAEHFWLEFPDPAAASTDTPRVISSTVFPGPVYSHQGRSVCFDGSLDAHGTQAAWNCNEHIWYTNQNLPTIQPTVAQTFGAENASGYNAVVSHNHQETLWCKNQGGALLVRGDINIPTVLRLPAFPHTTQHKPAVCPLGVVVLDQLYTGAWLWNGGESAVNISADSLDGNAFSLGSTSGIGGSGYDGIGTTDFRQEFGVVHFWYNWVLFPGNWAWNWQDNSWWRIEDPNVIQFMHYDSIFGQLFASPSSITATTQNVQYTGIVNVPSTSYRWKSLPIPVGDPEMVHELREMVLSATGVGNITVTFTKQDGSTEAHTFSVNSTHTPVHMRDQCIVQAQTMTVQIDVTGTGTAQQTPIVHEIRMGLSQSMHYPSRLA